MREYGKNESRVFRRIPFFVILVILPIIIHGKEAESPLSGYVWGGSLVTGMDFFGYYRSLFFSMTVLWFFMVDLMDSIKEYMEGFCRLGRRRIFATIIFLAGLCLSVAFSDSRRLAFVSPNGTYETFPVILAYVLLFFYVRNAVKSGENMRFVAGTACIGALFCAIWGLLELLGVRLTEQKWFQYLYLSKKDYNLVGNIYNRFGNRVSLTFYNPDYAGQYLCMIIPVVWAVSCTMRKTAYKNLLRILTGILAVLALQTGYRGVLLVAIIMTAFFAGAMFRRRKGGHTWQFCLAAFAVCAVISLFTVDVFGNFGIFSGIVDDRHLTALTKIRLEKHCLLLGTDKEEAWIDVTDGIRIYKRVDGGLKPVDDCYDEETGIVETPILSGVEIELDTEEKGAEEISLYDRNCVWEFHNTKEGLVFINPAGQAGNILEAETVFPKKWDSVGSGRFYIWSRTLPVLRDCLFLGKGCGSFATVFPQEDYVWKARAFGTNVMVVDRVENLYLAIWLQYGFFAFLAFLVFLGSYFLSGCRCFFGRVHRRRTEEETLGLGFFTASLCYLVSCLFSDGTVYVMPAFILFFGTAFAYLETVGTA